MHAKRSYQLKRLAVNQLNSYGVGEGSDGVSSAEGIVNLNLFFDLLIVARPAEWQSAQKDGPQRILLASAF